MGTWDSADSRNLFFEMRPRRRAAALLAFFWAVLLAAGGGLLYHLLSVSVWAAHPNSSLDIPVFIFGCLCSLIAGYMLATYLVWALGRAPMLTLDREAMRFRPAPWRELVVRWVDVARVEVHAIAIGPMLPGHSFSRTRITLRVDLRPEARDRYLHRRWLAFRMLSFLLPISVADLAATIEDFTSVERRALWL